MNPPEIIFTITSGYNNNNNSKRKMDAPSPDVILNEEQQHIFEKVMSSESNMFITGPGGTGKTFLIGHIAASLRQKLRKRIHIAAYTGTAAANIGGTTIHSLFGIAPDKPIDQDFVDKLKKKTQTVDKIRELDVLIIDEVSMLGSRLFEGIDFIARNIRGRYCKDFPFGKIRLLLFGDFYQLQPIGEEFCFKSPLWKEITYHYELTKIIRQSDKTFAECLNNVRLGNVTPEVIKLLKSRECPREEAEKDSANEEGKEEEEIKPTLMYARNLNTDRMNQMKLDALPGEPVVFKAEFSTTNMYNTNLLDRFKEQVEKMYPMKVTLVLKVGAQVMLTKNIDVSSGLVNGSRGIVTGFRVDKVPIVKFCDGRTRAMSQERWEQVYGENGKYANRVYQIPLFLAWAATIHKTQGATLDKVKEDLSGIWSPGQAYVALSRARTLEGLTIMDKFDPKCVVVDPSVHQFYEKIREQRRQLDSGERIDNINTFVKRARQMDKEEEEEEEEVEEVEDNNTTVYFTKGTQEPRVEIAEIIEVDNDDNKTVIFIE